MKNSIFVRVSLILVVSILVLFSCQQKKVKTSLPQPPAVQQNQNLKSQKFEVLLQPLKKLPNEKVIYWGGFSALHFIEKEATGNLLFWTLTDRGPNGQERKKAGLTYRSFLWPDFHPSLVKLRLNKQEQTVEVIESVPMKNSTGEFLTGLPPVMKNGPNARKYEVATNQAGDEIELPGLGVDPESLGVDEQKHFWVGEEYEPSILEFDENGTLLAHIKPVENENQKPQKNQLPYDYRYRKLNRGFEALSTYKNKVYFMTQSPLEFENKPSIIRVGVFNITTRKYEAEYIYPLKTHKVDKIGDLQMINENQFYVIEQNGEVGPDSVHLIYKVDLSKATNLVKKPLKQRPEFYKEGDFPKGFQMVQKELILDLVKMGYSEFEKVEGLALVDDQTIAVINDNDFGVTNDEIGSRPSVMGLFQLK